MTKKTLILLVSLVGGLTGCTTEDACHVALNRFWVEVVASGIPESATQKAESHRTILAHLDRCENVTPYFNYDEGGLGEPEGQYSIAIFAIYLDDVDLLKSYVSGGHPIDLLPNPYSESSVMWAVHGRSPSVLAWLIQQGVDVNLAGDDGRTPLMIAATHDQSVIKDLGVLIMAGANVNAIDSQGRSALVYALWTDNRANSIYLIASGANVEDARSFLLGDLKDIRSDEHRDSVERQLAMLDSVADVK